MRKERPNIDGVLYTDHKTDSEKARGLLRSNGIVFEERISPEDYRPEPGFELPTFNALEGQFRGIKGIRVFVDVVKDDPGRRLVRRQAK